MGVSVAHGSEAMLSYAGADRDTRLIDGARKEGQVVFYSAMIVNQALRPVADGFMKKYPFVKMSYWRGDGREIVTKLTAEVRGGNLVADVIEGTGVSEFAIEGDLVQPFQSPLSSAYPQSYRDPHNLWVATRLSYFSAAYNTRLVPDPPKSYEALLEPKWTGKLSWGIAGTGATLFLTNLRMAWGEEKAMAYFRKLAGQKVVNFGAGSTRTLVDRVMAGEYAIALSAFAHHPLISAAKGAPVASQLMDPVASTASTISIPKNVRRPHAAMLLVDYILSAEGQAVLAKAEYFPARPDTPSLPSLASVVPQAAGMPENFIGPENLLKYSESSDRIYQELFR